MQGEAALDEGLTTPGGVGADLDCLANVDLLPGDIKLVPLNESMIVFCQGVWKENWWDRIDGPGEDLR